MIPYPVGASPRGEQPTAVGRPSRRSAAHRAGSLPANPEECFYMAAQAFDLTERLQTPVMVLSDIDIGMNDWMCRDLKWDDTSIALTAARC